MEGAAPIQRAIEAETKSGVTTMQMQTGLDTGPMLHQIQQDKPLDTFQTLHDRLAP